LDTFGIAAAYAFHIAETEAFLDGNKRTAISSALTFLESNGVPTTTQTAALYDGMIAIAEKRMNKSELAQLVSGFICSVVSASVLSHFSSLKSPSTQ
jgi:death-on-curing protein